MNDLTPNDLSHMSDEDFNALCPQGHHAPGAEPLSPAAQAVLDAYLAVPPTKGARPSIAAALRAAADQVVTKPIRLPRNSYAEGAYDQRLNDHQRLLAIAAELEGQ